MESTALGARRRARRSGAADLGSAPPQAPPARGRPHAATRRRRCRPSSGTPSATRPRSRWASADAPPDPGSDRRADHRDEGPCGRRTLARHRGCARGLTWTCSSRTGRQCRRRSLRAGFVEVGEPEDYDDSHHLRPVAYPGFPFAVEIHRRPKWPNDRPPTLRRGARGRRPRRFRCRTSSRHRRLTTRCSSPVTRGRTTRSARIGPLADVAAMMLAAGRRDGRAVARAWGRRAPLVRDGSGRRPAPAVASSRPPRAHPIWHRHLYEARSGPCSRGTSSDWSAQRPPDARGGRPSRCAGCVRTLRPWPGERWGSKLGARASPCAMRRFASRSTTRRCSGRGAGDRTRSKLDLCAVVAPRSEA